MARITSEVNARPEHLKMIRQAKPLINPDIAEAELNKEPEIGGTYQVYNVGLAELKTTRIALKAAPLLRVQELSAKKISAAYEVNTANTDSDVPAVHTDTKYLAKLNTGFQAADKLAQASASSARMRVINIPALHTEAYWLHYDDSSKDMVVPIHSFFFPEGQPVPYATFMAKMTEAAKTVPDTSNNELGG